MTIPETMYEQMRQISEQSGLRAALGFILRRAQLDAAFDRSELHRSRENSSPWWLQTPVIRQAETGHIVVPSMVREDGTYSVHVFREPLIAKPGDRWELVRVGAGDKSWRIVYPGGKGAVAVCRLVDLVRRCPPDFAFHLRVNGCVLSVDPIHGQWLAPHMRFLRWR